MYVHGTLYLDAVLYISSYACYAMGLFFRCFFFLHVEIESALGSIELDSYEVILLFALRR